MMWYGLAGYWWVVYMEIGRIWAWKLGKCKPIFDYIPATNPTQHIQNGPDDPLTTTNINHHHVDILKDDGMD
jgi:hypothetical protein